MKFDLLREKVEDLQEKLEKRDSIIQQQNDEIVQLKNDRKLIRNEKKVRVEEITQKDLDYAKVVVANAIANKIIETERVKIYHLEISLEMRLINNKLIIFQYFIIFLL